VQGASDAAPPTSIPASERYNNVTFYPAEFTVIRKLGHGAAGVVRLVMYQPDQQMMAMKASPIFAFPISLSNLRSRQR
jgi:hypothetical protein